MIYKGWIFTLAIVPVLLLTWTCTTNIAGNGSQTGNPAVVGTLYASDGKTPAKGAKVYLVPADHNPRQGLPKALAAAPESTVTNDSGIYRLDSVPAGTYNVLAAGSGNLAYQDSINVKTDTQTQVPADTLKAPGGLRGLIRLQPGDDARTVFLLFMGTNTWGTPDDSTGKFGVANMPEGTYRVRILTTLDAYVPKDTVLSVTAGKVDTLTHDIVLQYTGIPVVGGLKISYDTLKQIVTLSWNKPTTGRKVAGYNLYRKRSDSTSFVSIKSGMTDTVYRDSTGVQDQTYEYRVTVVDSNGTEGVKSSADSVLVTSAFPFLKSIGGPGTNDGQFNEPGEMAFDAQGNLYVLDPFNIPGKVHKFDSQGKIVKTWAPIGAGELRDIEVVNDSILILDRGKKSIAVFDTVGDSLGEWPILSSSDPMNFTVKSQIVYIADRQNNMILKYSLAGNSISTWTGIGSNTFRALKSITTGPSTVNFYVLDSDSLGYVADSSGNLVSQFKIAQRAVVDASSQWFLLKSGNLIYTAIEKHTVFVIDLNGNMIGKFGSFGSANGQFKWPVSVIEFSNKIFISDAQNSRIQVFNEQ